MSTWMIQLMIFTSLFIFVGIKHVEQTKVQQFQEALFVVVHVSHDNSEANLLSVNIIAFVSCLSFESLKEPRLCFSDFLFIFLISHLVFELFDVRGSYCTGRFSYDSTTLCLQTVQFRFSKIGFPFDYMYPVLHLYCNVFRFWGNIQTNQLIKCHFRCQATFLFKPSTAWHTQFIVYIGTYDNAKIAIVHFSRKILFFHTKNIVINSVHWCVWLAGIQGTLATAIQPKPCIQWKKKRLSNQIQVGVQRH